jgi:hypothetical protein
MLSQYAQKLLAWFNLYKITATDYDTRLNTLPKYHKRGVFATALAELVSGGY